MSEEQDHPRYRSFLLGQQKVTEQLLDLWAKKKLPHALLLTGKPGIGKATLAYRFAAYVNACSAGDGAHPFPLPQTQESERLLRAGAHPEIKAFEREENPKTGRLKDEITVDQIRSIPKFLGLTSSERKWRVVIIDEAERMNINAQNALLKVLEEPPQGTLFLLISSSPGRLLQTVRSRCHRIALDPLSLEEAVEVVQRLDGGFDQAEIVSAVRLGENTPGWSLRFLKEEGFALYGVFLEHLKSLPTIDIVGLQRLADDLTRVGAEKRYDLFWDLALGRLNRMIVLGQAHKDMDEILNAEQVLWQELYSQASVQDWLDLWEKLTGLYQDITALNLDKRQAFLSYFLDLQETISKT